MFFSKHRGKQFVRMWEDLQTPSLNSALPFIIKLPSGSPPSEWMCRRCIELLGDGLQQNVDELQASHIVVFVMEGDMRSKLVTEPGRCLECRALDLKSLVFQL